MEMLNKFANRKNQSTLIEDEIHIQKKTQIIINFIWD